MLISSNRYPRNLRGVTLIEMMVALVLALIVSGAVLALVIATMKSNSDTIRATRLTQELRTTTEVISRTIRRAQSVSDPVGNIGVPDSTLLMQACNTPDISVAGCIRLGYDCGWNAAGNAVGNFVSIRREVAGGIGAVVIATGTGPQACTAAGTTVSSPAINITNLTFASPIPGTTDTAGIRINLRGQFASTGLASDQITRTISQDVRVRSPTVTP